MEFDFLFYLISVFILQCICYISILSIIPSAFYQKAIISTMHLNTFSSLFLLRVNSPATIILPIPSNTFNTVHLELPTVHHEFSFFAFPNQAESLSPDTQAKKNDSPANLRHCRLLLNIFQSKIFSLK